MRFIIEKNINNHPSRHHKPQNKCCHTNDNQVRLTQECWERGCGIVDAAVPDLRGALFPGLDRLDLYLEGSEILGGLCVLEEVVGGRAVVLLDVNRKDLGLSEQGRLLEVVGSLTPEDLETVLGGRGEFLLLYAQLEFHLNGLIVWQDCFERDHSVVFGVVASDFESDVEARVIGNFEDTHYAGIVLSAYKFYL
jgi:hypothetical protein